jgi:hypothetical protein
MKKRKVVKIDLSSLFGPDDDDGTGSMTVEVSAEDVATVVSYTPPTHLTLSMRDCVCRGCGNRTREVLGIFTEYHQGDTMRLERIPAETELERYDYLPRRVDYLPPLSIPACNICWFADAIVRAAQPHEPAVSVIPDNLLPNVEI